MKSSRPRLTPLLAAVLLAAATVASAPLLAQQKSFEGETSTVLVEVPVTVVHDGEPVRGLERDDFRVFDDREARQLVDFEMVDLTEISAAEATDPLVLPAAARRHFLMLFDFSFSRPGTIARARRAAQRLVAERLHPGDLVSVATYSSVGPRVVVGFTSDRTQIALALESLGFDGVLDGVRLAADPLGLTVASPSSANVSSLVTASGRDADQLLGLGDEATPGNGVGAHSQGDVGDHFRDIAVRIERQDTNFQAQQINHMSRALSDLARVLAATEGQKHVLYLSEGFDNSLFLGREASATETVQLWRGNYTQGNPDARYGDPRVLAGLDGMLEEFRRAGAVIQAIDIHGLQEGGEDRRLDEQGLFYLANETGGELFETFNDLGDAMDRMLQRTSVTYLLTFRAEDLAEDGAYHRLRVEVDGLPRRAKVHHRAGYYAPLPYGDRTPIAQRMTAAQKLLSGEVDQEFGLTALVTPFAGPTADGPAYVPVVVEVDGAGFLGGATEGRVPAELFVYALDPAGGVTDFFTQRVEVDVERAGEALRASGLKLFGHVDLPAGDHAVRVLVRNGATGRSSLQVARVTVPRLAAVQGAAADPHLLPALFPEAPGSWIVVPEPADQQRADVAFPFMLRGEPYLPAVRPRIPTDRTVFVNLVAYDLDAESPGGPIVSARVLDASGAPTGRTVLSIEDRFRLEGESAERLLASLETDGLTPGSYELEVTLTDPETGRSSTSTAPFVVGASG